MHGYKSRYVAVIILAAVAAGLLIHSITGGNGGVTVNTTYTGTQFQPRKITLGDLPRRVLVYDSLYREYPNDTLLEVVVERLREAGFQVDVYKARNATLDPLVSMGQYGIVILRAHGAYNNDPNTGMPLGAYVYTGLHVSEAQAIYAVDYVLDGLKSGLFAQAVIPRAGVPLNELPKYLSVSPKFFSEAAGSMNNTVIFNTGCFGMNDDRLAGTLLSKGAYMYIGWDGNVTWTFSDYYLEKWVEVLLQYRDPVEATNIVNKTLGADPGTGAAVRYEARG